MKTIEVIVEYADNNLSAYISGVPIIVIGDNIGEIKANLAEAVELYLEEAEHPVTMLQGEYSFVYRYDTQTLLNYYSKVFSYVALQYLTGINQKQLIHYAMGISKPRERQKRKIEVALHNLGQELSAISL